MSRCKKPPEWTGGKPQNWRELRGFRGAKGKERACQAPCTASGFLTGVMTGRPFGFGQDLSLMRSQLRDAQLSSQVTKPFDSISTLAASQSANGRCPYITFCRCPRVVPQRLAKSSRC